LFQVTENGTLLVRTDHRR